MSLYREFFPLNESSQTEVSKDAAISIYDEMGYDFSFNEFLMGMNIELEHNDVTEGDPKKTAMIAAAHLREVPNYYTLLKKYVETSHD